MGNSPHRLWETHLTGCGELRAWLGHVFSGSLGWQSLVGLTLLGLIPLRVVWRGRSIAGPSAINRDPFACRVTTVTLGLVDREKRKADSVWGPR